MTNSRRGGLPDPQAPRFAVVPVAEWSHAEDAAFLASAYGLTPDEWQFDVLEAWLGVRRGGYWAASTCGVAVPRQNGKNAILEVRELYGMVELGEKFLHTAHEVKTARKAFLRLASFFENARKYPELAELVAPNGIRRTNGQEAIVLANGGSVEFVARSKGSGRGFTVDVLVLDEAQELSDEALEALKPTISAAPTGNPQTIYTGTPPSLSMNGDVFTRTRQSAITGGSKRLAWHEWSVEGVVDLDDRALWAATNPALGGRLNIDVIQSERAEFSDDGFARERLGRWLDPLAGSDLALDPAGWVETTDPASKVEQVEAFGVAVSLDRAVAGIGVAGLREDGLPHLEVVAHKRGTGWVVDECKALAEESVGAVFCIDGSGPAASLIDPLEQAGLQVIILSARDIGAATAWVIDAVRERALRHGPQPELDAAAAGATTRNIGDGIAGSALKRRSASVDIVPLEAVTLAAHVLPSVIPLDSVTAAFL